MYLCFYLLKMQDSALPLHARRLLSTCKFLVTVPPVLAIQSSIDYFWESILLMWSFHRFIWRLGSHRWLAALHIFIFLFGSWFLHFLRTATSLNSLSRSLPPSLGEVRQFWERMWGTAGPHHFSLWARERRRWQSDAQSLSLLMTAPFSIIITIIRKLGGQKVFTVNLPPPKER